MKLTKIFALLGSLLLLAFVGLGWYYSEEIPYLLSGWTPLAEGVTPQMMAVSDSGALVFGDYDTHTLYFFPEGSQEPENYITYPLEVENPQSPCFFEGGQKLLFPQGDVTILDLASGEYEQITGFSEGYDCTTLTNGDLVVASYGTLAFYSEGHWTLVEDLLLGVPFQVAEGPDGSVWIGLEMGKLYLFDRQTQVFKLMDDLRESSFPYQMDDSIYRLFNNIDWVTYTWEGEEITELISFPNGNLIIESRALMLEWQLVDDQIIITRQPDYTDFYPYGQFFFQSVAVDQATGRIWQAFGGEWRTFIPGEDAQVEDTLFPYGFAPHIAIDSQNQILYIAARAFGDNPGGVYFQEIVNSR